MPLAGLERPVSADVRPSLRTEVLEVLLDRHGRRVTREDVTTALAVHGPGVAAALDALLAEQTVHEQDGRLALTELGQQRAMVAVRRHRLTERLLSDLLGVEWWQVHHEAESFEGRITPVLEARLVEVLGDPGTCPHGNPIPGSANRPDQTRAVRLADAPVGPVTVVRITETLEGDDEALQLLQACGFVPGRDAELKRREQGWVEVAGTVHDAALPPHVAAHTYVLPR